MPPFHTVLLAHRFPQGVILRAKRGGSAFRCHMISYRYFLMDLGKKILVAPTGTNREPPRRLEGVDNRPISKRGGSAFRCHMISYRYFLMDLGKKILVAPTGTNREPPRRLEGVDNRP